MSNPNQTISSARSNESSRLTGLRFPGDLGPTCMVMSFQKYSYSGTEGRSNKETNGVIILPIPSQIEDGYGINIGQKDLGASGAAFADMMSGQGGNLIAGAMDAAQNFGSDLGEGLTGGAQGIVDAATGASQKVKYFSRSAIDSLTPGLGMALDAVNGTTVNPHTTLGFDGVNLKEFNFSWQLSPKNASESATLVSIKNKIRQSILPSVEALGDGAQGSLSRAFLSYPDLVHIYFMGLSEDDWIWFKPSMIKNFSMNYSPQGNVILEGGKPGFITMSMSIQEARIHTREDYITDTRSASAG